MIVKPPVIGISAGGDVTAEGLAAAVSQAAIKGPPPVHLWNPPFCGDIDIRIARDGTWFYRGSPIGGLGMQSHFGNFLSAPPDVLAMLDRFSVFGLPIQATEFDVNLKDEVVQADYLRDFMTALFSHPQVNAILMWGFWEGQHWLPDAALFRKNWQVKPNGIMWSNLVFKEWWTTTNAVADATGNATVRGFKGDYELTISTPNQTRTVATSLTTNAVVAATLPVTKPALSVAIHNGQLQFTWPGTAAGWTLRRRATHDARLSAQCFFASAHGAGTMRTNDARLDHGFLRRPRRR